MVFPFDRGILFRELENLKQYCCNKFFNKHFLKYAYGASIKVDLKCLLNHQKPPLTKCGCASGPNILIPFPKWCWLAPTIQLLLPPTLLLNPTFKLLFPLKALPSPKMVDPDPQIKFLLPALWIIYQRCRFHYQRMPPWFRMQPRSLPSLLFTHYIYTEIETSLWFYSIYRTFYSWYRN